MFSQYISHSRRNHRPRSDHQSLKVLQVSLKNGQADHVFSNSIGCSFRSVGTNSRQASRIRLDLYPGCQQTPQHLGNNPFDIVTR